MDILEKLEMFLFEKQKKRKKRKEVGVTGAADKKAQKKYVGMGSIKDLLNK